MTNETTEYGVEVVEWLASSDPIGWHAPDDADCVFTKCMTVGFVVRETDTAILLVGSVQDTPVRLHSGGITIPKTSIIKRTEIRRLRISHPEDV